MNLLSKLADFRFSQWLFIATGIWLETITLPPLYQYFINNIPPTFASRVIIFGIDALVLNIAISIAALFIIIAGIKGYE